MARFLPAAGFLIVLASSALSGAGSVLAADNDPLHRLAEKFVERIGPVAQPPPDTAASRQAGKPRTLNDLARLFVARLGPQPGSSAAGQIAPVSTTEVPEGAGIPDGEELIFEVHIGDRQFDESILVIKQGAGILFSLREITDLVGFKIKVDNESGKATGWFINEKNTFDLNLATREIIIAGEERTIDSNNVKNIDGELYVHSDTFKAWFGVVVGINFRDLTITLNPRVPLPLQQRIARREKFDTMTRYARGPPELPRKELPLQLATLPFVNVQLNTRRFDRSNQASVLSNSYSVVGNSELAFMSS